MASKALARSAPRPQVIVMAPPKRGRIRRAAGRARSIARRAAPHAKRAVPVTSAVLAAAAVGWGRQKGYFDQLPVVMGSKTTTLGIAGFIAYKKASNPTLKLVGLAAMMAAATDFGRVQAGGAAGDDSGDDDGPLGGGEDSPY